MSTCVPRFLAASHLLATQGVAWCVGQLVTSMSPAKTAEPIEMPFRVVTRVGPHCSVV